MTPPRWSVVIPAFNEAHRLPSYLDDVVGHLEGRGVPWEVIVVDDGSTDATGDVVLAAALAHPRVRLLALGGNHGKGGAVRAGMLASTGEYRLFADADGATPIAELKRLEAALAAGADVVIGSRALADTAVSIDARMHRIVAGRIFNWLVARAGLRGISDSQCGFKAFTAAAAMDLFGRLATSGFGFDVELLLLAQASGYRVAEVAVNWADRPGSKVGVIRNGPAMLWEIWCARRRLRAAARR